MDQNGQILISEIFHIHIYVIYLILRISFNVTRIPFLCFNSLTNLLIKDKSNFKRIIPHAQKKIVHLIIHVL